MQPTFDFARFFASRPVIAAPMAGVSDAVFRQISLEHGADLACCEMVSAKGLSYANERTRNLIELAPNEPWCVVQLFGHEPAVMAREAQWVEDLLGERLAYLDINMGCPARKIVKKGDGAALMESPALAADIVRAVTGAVEHPVTVKFRRGYEMNDETAPAFAQRMEEAGAAAVAVHGRFGAQLYWGTSDHGCISRVKEAVSIPVVGNGDVVSGETARALISDTNCDAIMIGRGAQGNPWVFEQVKAALEDRPEPAAPTVAERIAQARDHARLLCAHDAHGAARMRKHAAWYVAGLPGASVARRQFSACSTFEDFDRVLTELSNAALERDDR